MLFSAWGKLWSFGAISRGAIALSWLVVLVYSPWQLMLKSANLAAATSSTHPLLMLVSLVIGIANLAFSKSEVA
jgi:hypothetical protein